MPTRLFCLVQPAYVFRFDIPNGYFGIKSGEAAQYAKEMKAREKFYLSDEKNIVVEELTVKPEMLYHLDITTIKITGVI